MRSFNKPFFLTYLSLISFQVYYIFLVVKDPIFGHRVPKTEAEGAVKKAQPVRPPMSPFPSAKSPMFYGEDPTIKQPPATLEEQVKFGGVLFLFYWAAVYLGNLSFQHTTVSSSTIMSTTNGIFLLILGLIFSTDHVNILKLVAVTMTLVGATTLVLSELKLGEWRTIGNMMSFSSAFFYSLYSVVLKRLSKDPGRVSIPLLLATVGSYSMIFLWPMFPILHFAGWETFVWPFDLASWASILFNVIFGFLIPTYLWTVAFVLTSPLIVALGISCTIPLTLLFELGYSKQVSLLSVLAGAFVVAGFLMMNAEAIFPESLKLSPCCTRQDDSGTGSEGKQ